ncbi:MAG: 4-hydroxy-tetrahydrodipicolinate reductase [Planctomycetota bacterium]|jgi:4-hydroxy-tetrahydrodipicolinate reductase
MIPKLIVNGAAGRMGRRIVALATQEEQLDLVGAMDKMGHPDLGKDAGVLAGVGQIGVILDSFHPGKANVMIDFSLPDATDVVIDSCLQNDVALVLGTTGLSDAQLKKVQDAGKKIPLVQANNMSVGMNVLFRIVGRFAEMLGDDYDIEIVESHHRFKKDSPSGSALTLARNIAHTTGRNWPACLVHGREGKETLRQAGTIGMHSVRAGDISGEHSVIFSTLGETVTLQHRAHNRYTFANGALRAARWIVGKKAGVYSMGDVLGLV